VQDLDPKVQQTIHRIQPFENLKRVTEWAREIGYESVSFDLIYGLPFQTPFTVSETIDKIITLRPDRISFYSYAHVPWLKPGQRGYGEADLPSPALKRHLYEIGRHILKKSDYGDIGMDHFALRHDSLFKAHLTGKLHRNFMGYTTTNTDVLIGLGASAISDSGTAYAQNAKTVEEYSALLHDDVLPVIKGHILSEQDVKTKECILQLSCNGRVDEQMMNNVVDRDILDKLIEMEHEGILYFYNGGLEITTSGTPFLRNVCSVFDHRMKHQSQGPMFSKAI
jgi:oxygen-independent coproporphyrinogen-3 oxidase